MTTPDLLQTVAALCDDAATAMPPGTSTEAIETIRSRLDEPLRVAIAGRVNAGKSTLLNALVGERLAPTDAGECTRVVTWYRQGIGYDVTARLEDGTTRQVPFSRHDGALDMDIAGIDAVEELVVTWPSRRLATLTLIDTPGLEGHDAARRRRARAFLGSGEDAPGQADAVIYLMRHLHERDAEFLDTFRDSSVPRPSPANAIAVLSRADEIGGGRLGSLESAQAIADRYAADPRVRTLCADVVPVAGLLAETAATLQEHEAAALQTLAGLEDSERASLLLSVDRFCAPGVAGVPAAVRRSLLSRLGLFGVRHSISLFASGDVSDAADLAEHLGAASGIASLVRALDELFAGRAAALKAQTALATLADVLASAPGDAGVQVDRLRAEVERLQMGAAEFVALRLTHLARDPELTLGFEDGAEVDRLVSGGPPARRLGLDADASDDELRTAAIAGAARWRARAEHPLTTGPLAELCDLMVRSYEGLHAAL